ncbi:hypothetical protein J4401_06585 [Candidatus Woesearchaeota archaeon]|nr:hypothetical protein [Candidatus Woesearchaeota archaeon]
MAQLTTDMILEPFANIYDIFVSAFPGFLWFVVFVSVGYLIASAVAWIVKHLLYRFNVDKKLRSMDLHDSIGEISIAKLTGIILKWYIFILFVVQGATFLQLGELSGFIQGIINWLPNLILSIAIIVVGLIIIDYIVNKLFEIKNKYVHIIASIIKGILVVVVLFTAIEQLGIKTDLAQNIFLMIVAAILITLSLALGIGLGLSFKDELKPFVKKLSKRIK